MSQEIKPCPSLVLIDAVCADMDDDCCYMTPDQVERCASDWEYAGRCPFAGRVPSTEGSKKS